MDTDYKKIGSQGGKNKWANLTEKQRQAHIKKMSKAASDKRRKDKELLVKFQTEERESE